MIVEWLNIVPGVVFGLSLILGAYFAGKRSKREDTEQWRSSSNAYKETSVRAQATLAEKDLLVASKEETISRMAEKLDEKDSVIATLGGNDVSKQVNEMLLKVLDLFAHQAEALSHHDEGSAARDARMVEAVAQLGGLVQSVADAIERLTEQLATNGRSKES